MEPLFALLIHLYSFSKNSTVKWSVSPRSSNLQQYKVEENLLFTEPGLTTVQIERHRQKIPALIPLIIARVLIKSSYLICNWFLHSISSKCSTGAIDSDLKTDITDGGFTTALM